MEGGDVVEGEITNDAPGKTLCSVIDKGLLQCGTGCSKVPMTEKGNVIMYTDYIV